MTAIEHELTPVEHGKQLPLLLIYDPVLHVIHVEEFVQYIHPNGHFSQVFVIPLT